VAEADPDSAKQIMELLSRWGIPSDTVDNGSEALLYLCRKRPPLAILGGHLPGVTSGVLTEVVRRNAELRALRLIRVLTLDEPVAAPEFDADHSLEPGDLPDGLEPLLERLGFGQRPEPCPRKPSPLEPAKSPAQAAPAAPQPTPNAEERRVGSEDRREAPRPEPVVRKKGTRGRPVSSDPQIAAAERLARIIVSDIILYNEGKFANGVQSGNAAVAVKEELSEGTALFNQRIPEEVRRQRDFLGEELKFRANQLRDKG
jgi:CheY-like chemotaxis protein